MTSAEKIYLFSLCDRIMAACNRINKKLDVMDEQQRLFTYTDSFASLQYPSWPVATAVAQPRPPPDPPNGQSSNYIQSGPDQQVPTYGLVLAYDPELYRHQFKPYPAPPCAWEAIPAYQHTHAQHLELPGWKQPNQTSNPHTPQPPYVQSAYQNVGYPPVPTSLSYDQPYTAPMPLAPPHASFVDHQEHVTEYQNLCNGRRHITEREEMKEMRDTIAGGDSEENREGFWTIDDDNFIDDNGVDPAHRNGSDNEQSPRHAPQAEEGDGDAEINELFKIGKTRKKTRKSAAILKIFFDLPIGLEQFGQRDQLKKNGFEKVIMFLVKPYEETRNNQKLAQDLVHKWSRLTFIKSSPLAIFYGYNEGRPSTIRCVFDPGGDTSPKLLFSTLFIVSWFSP